MTDGDCGAPQPRGSVAIEEQAQNSSEQSSNELRSELEAQAREIFHHVRLANTVVVALVFGAYGLAFYVWTLGQNLGAIVIATLGYGLVRSLRKISFNLTWRRYANRPTYAEVIASLDADILAKGEEAAIRQVVTSMAKREAGGN